MAGLLSEAGVRAPATPDTSVMELLALVAGQAAAGAEARRGAEEARDQVFRRPPLPERSVNVPRPRQRVPRRRCNPSTRRAVSAC